MSKAQQPAVYLAWVLTGLYNENPNLQQWQELYVHHLEVHSWPICTNEMLSASTLPLHPAHTHPNTEDAQHDQYNNHPFKIKIRRRPGLPCFDIIRDQVPFNAMAIHHSKQVLVSGEEGLEGKAAVLRRCAAARAIWSILSSA